MYTSAGVPHPLKFTVTSSLIFLKGIEEGVPHLFDKTGAHPIAFQHSLEADWWENEDKHSRHPASSLFALTSCVCGFSTMQP